jgi:CRP-like cAMP-binding protein
MAGRVELAARSYSPAKEVGLLVTLAASVERPDTPAVACALEQWRRQFKFGPSAGYNRDSTSFLEQTPWNGIAAIISGAVALTRQDANGANTFLGLSGPGDVIGAEGYANNRTHYFTARPLTDVTLQYATADSVAATLMSSPSAAQFYAHWIWKFSCRITEHLAQTKTLNAADRLLVLLTSLGALVGERCRDGIVVRIDSDVTLADLLNLEASNFSRTKRLLMQAGMITQHGRTYRLSSQSGCGHATRYHSVRTNIAPIII